jgi:hypothetical protein
MSTSAAASDSERASASTVQRSGTTFVLRPPPWIEPTFAVVSVSMRPSRIPATAFAAATTALRPASGRMPAWAAWPRKRASRR